MVGGTFTNGGEWGARSTPAATTRVCVSPSSARRRAVGPFAFDGTSPALTCGDAAPALAGAPDLKFELLDVFTGVNSVAVYFQSSVRRLQVEVMELDADGRIARVLVHHRNP